MILPALSTLAAFGFKVSPKTASPTFTNHRFEGRDEYELFDSNRLGQNPVRSSAGVRNRQSLRTVSLQNCGLLSIFEICIENLFNITRKRQSSTLSSMILGIICIAIPDNLAISDVGLSKSSSFFGISSSDFSDSETLTTANPGNANQSKVRIFSRRVTLQNGIVTLSPTLSNATLSNDRFWVLSHFQTLPAESFRNFRSLTLLIFEGHLRLQQIEQNAFRDSGLIAIVIPAPVKSIGEASSHSCRALGCLTFESGSSLERIGPLAFQNTSLQSVHLPNTLTFLGDNSFRAIRTLLSINFERGSILKQTGADSFSETGIVKVTLPRSIEIIGAGCFHKCSSLESLAFESGLNLQRIEKDAFAETILKEVELPNSIKLISGRAFPKKSLKYISFCPHPTNFRFHHDSLEDESGKALIISFVRAVSVGLPKSVETIADGCFREHPTLETVTFKAGSALRQIEEEAFSNGKLKGTIELPGTVKLLASWCFYACKSLETVKFMARSELQEIGE
jgi:hypothetical protein